eukprot:gene15591-biopygen8177
MSPECDSTNAVVKHAAHEAKAADDAHACRGGRGGGSTALCWTGRKLSTGGRRRLETTENSGGAQERMYLSSGIDFLTEKLARGICGL